MRGYLHREGGGVREGWVAEKLGCNHRWRERRGNVDGHRVWLRWWTTRGWRRGRECVFGGETEQMKRCVLWWIAESGSDRRTD